jgi:hypothetical protein
MSSARDITRRLSISKGREVLSAVQVEKLPVGSLVTWPGNGMTLVVIPDGKLTQAALLLDRPGDGPDPGGEPVLEWGNSFQLIAIGSGSLPTHANAERAASKWWDSKGR